jgi:hypothetical protein
MNYLTPLRRRHDAIHDKRLPSLNTTQSRPQHPRTIRFRLFPRTQLFFRRSPLALHHLHKRLHGGYPLRQTLHGHVHAQLPRTHHGETYEGREQNGRLGKSSAQDIVRVDSRETYSRFEYSEVRGSERPRDIMHFRVGSLVSSFSHPSPSHVWHRVGTLFYLFYH